MQWRKPGTNFGRREKLRIIWHTGMWLQSAVRDRKKKRAEEMGQAVIVTGMVLTAMPVGDYDRRITILTKERGRISAFARGARRPQSQLLAAANPFTFGEFELYEGKSSYTITKASVKNYFRELAADLDAASMGFYFLEFAEYYCQENNDEREMLKLLYQSMRALASGKFDRALVRAVFELRAIAIGGEGPAVFSCMGCGKKEKLIALSVKRGGMFCEDCGKEASARRILDSTRYAMQFIIATPVERLYTFSLSAEVLLELTDILREYMLCYVRHEFKSLHIFS